MATVSLYLKSNKTANDLQQIMLRFSHKSAITTFSTGYSVPAKYWDGNKVSARYNAATELNRNIFQLKGELEKIVRDLEFERPDRSFTPADVRARFEPIIKGEATPPAQTLRAKIAQMLTVRKSELTKATVTGYKVLSSKHLATWEAQLGEELLLTDVNKAFYEDFRKFLLESQRLTDNTVNKLLVRVKAVTNWAEGRGDAVAKGHNAYSGKEHGKEVVFLAWEELQQLATAGLPPGLEVSRDLFLFACYTGLRISDISNWHPSNVKGDFIRLKQIKTRVDVIIPLNPYSRAILAKYGGGLPKLASQHVNANLKIIGKLAGLGSDHKKVQYRGYERLEQVMPKYKLLTFHTGRSTFIMNHLAKGVAAEAVMKMTGHRDFRSFNRYVRFTDELLRNISVQVYG